MVIHGTFILGLPVETQQTIENTIRFAQELDVFSIQVSLAAPYPGTELYEMARQNGWFAKKDKTDLVEDDGFQQSALEYPGLSKDEIFEAVDRFYRALLPAPETDSAHHQDDAGGQGRLCAPLPRRLRILQEPATAQSGPRSLQIGSISKACCGCRCLRRLFGVGDLHLFGRLRLAKDFRALSLRHYVLECR